MSVAKELWCRAYHKSWFWEPVKEYDNIFYCTKCLRYRKAK